jgi:hypothetical protein
MFRLSAHSAPGGQPMKLVPSRQTLLLPPQMESVRQRLERWRRNRKHRSPIPKGLWASAADLACRYGLAKTARALRLDYYSLKERMEAGKRQGSRKMSAQPAFVELIPPPAPAVPECTMELENSSGARMRIHLKGAGMPDLTDLSESFWRMGR